MLWCCIDMRLADDRWEHLPTFNECARRLLEVATTFGCAPSSLARVPCKPQKLLGSEFRVSPRYLLCGVSLPRGGTGGVGVDERVEGASGRSPGFVLLDVDQVEQAPQICPLVEPHGGVPSFDHPNQASDEVEAVRTVHPLGASVRPGGRGKPRPNPREPTRLPRT